MKNVVIFILFVTTVVTGYVAATASLRMKLEGIDGKRETLGRGDVTLLINATGQIKSSRRIEMKSEASGEVIEIFRHAGDLVTKGELIIRLDRVDEERNVRRSELEQTKAQARLDDAIITKKQAETADLASAQASLDRQKENVKFAKFRMDKLAKLPEHQRNEEETIQRETTYNSQLADLAAAAAELERRNYAIPRAEQAIIQARANLESAKSNLGDAEKRLRETDIVSPIDGIVALINVQIGEVIQGGKTTLTGGTVLAVLLDRDKLIVQAEVDESDIGRVLKIAPEWATPGHDGNVQMPEDVASAAKGMDHLPIITVESFRGEEFTGMIERIYPESRILSGVVTYLVDVVIVSDNKSRLLTGMRADVRFTSQHVSNVIICPNEAISKGPTGALGVFIPKKGADPTERATEFVVCRFGLGNGNYSEVLEGLPEGAEVYTALPAKKKKGES